MFLRAADKLMRLQSAWQRGRLLTTQSVCTASSSLATGGSIRLSMAFRPCVDGDFVRKDVAVKFQPMQVRTFCTIKSAYRSSTEPNLIDDDEEPDKTPTTVDGVKKTESQISEEEKDQKLVVHCDEYLQPFTNRMLGLGEYNGGMAKFNRHSILNDYLGGFRPGELTILSGPPGSGKTTLLSGLCVDLLEQNIATLFCSLEVDNLTVMQWMMQQQAGMTEIELQNTMRLADATVNFSRLPLFFLHNYGEWLSTMNPIELSEFLHAVVRMHKINHVVVDNTQYLVSNTMNVTGNDKYRVEELLITGLRQLATHANVHVTVVSHLRKEREGEITLNSISGSSRQVQEANNVLLIDNKLYPSDNGARRVRRFLHILKNRHNGKLALDGDIELSFDFETRTPRLKDAKVNKKYSHVLKTGQ